MTYYLPLHRLLQHQGRVLAPLTYNILLRVSVALDEMISQGQVEEGGEGGEGGLGVEVLLPDSRGGEVKEVIVYHHCRIERHVVVT